MANRGHSGSAYRRIWRVLLVEPDFIACWLCGQPIDQDLRKPHRMSKSLDMVIPFNKGGDPRDPNNYRPAHLGHNSSRSDGTPEEFRRRLRDKTLGCASRVRAPRATPARHWIADDTP